MTDDTLRELVLKHENTIEKLASSVESLVVSQVETNNKLEEITKYLAKQAVFDTKFENVNRSTNETFKRAFSRIDKLESTQNSNSGCKSVQLLGKDIIGLEKEYGQMARVIGEVKINTEKMEKRIDAMPSPVTVRWIVGLTVVYMVSFGSYIVSALQHNEVMITKLMEHIQ